ncbi:MAG: hypothetical protein ACOX1P_10745 [Thermoguttaceae bacterium]|jgi:hypothetical protein
MISPKVSRIRFQDGPRIRRAGRIIAGLAMAALLLEWSPRAASAQGSDRERRRQFVEGLLQTLIESQLPQQPRPPARPAGPPPARPAVRGAIEAAASLDAFAAESRKLLQALQSDWTRVAVAGPLVGDTAKVHHAASSLAARCRAADSLNPIADAYRNLNRDWRSLAHRIGETRGLGPECRQQVQAIDRHDQTLCSLLNVQPQSDRVGLCRHAIALGVDLQNLADDMEAELPASPEKDRLIALSREAQRQAAEVAEAVFGEAPHDAIATSYRDFRKSWGTLAAALQPVEIRDAQRSIRRIWQSDRMMHELLWLPYETDPRHMVHMAQILQKHIDALYKTVSLEDLIDLPPARLVLPTASEFYGLCEYFILCAENKESPESLAKAYWDLDAAWPGFSACFASTKSPEVQKILIDIERSMTALRDLLGIPPEIDWDLALQRSARLEYLAHQLEGNLRLALQSAGSYPSAVRGRVAATAEKSRAFCGACRELNAKVVARAARDQLARQSAKVAADWASLQTDLNTVFRERDLRTSTGEIATSLVELQAAFGP